MTAQTVFGVWLFMLPLRGMGPARLDVSAMVPVVTLASHWAYGLVLAWLYPLPSEAEARQASSGAAASSLPAGTKR